MKTHQRRYAILAMFSSAMLLTIVGQPRLEYGLIPEGCATAALSPSGLARRQGIELKEVAELLERGVSLQMMCAMSGEAIEEMAEGMESEPRPDSPDEWLRWRMLSLQDENGQIDPGGLMRGKAQLDEMKASAATDSRPAAGIARGAWVNVGPGNVGGRIRALAIHPTTPAIIWIGSVSGGIWKTTDGGATWAVLDDFMANLAVTSIVLNPMNPNELYTATGEGFFNADGLRGAGIFKSTNGGATWTQLASTSTAPSAGLTAFDFHYVNRLAISPNGATLLAAGLGGVFRSTDGGASFSRRTLGGVPITNAMTDIDFHPGNSNIAVASGLAKTIYSTDGGLTWQNATGVATVGQARVELAVAPSNGSIVYASVETSTGGAVYKSINAGQSYALVSNSPTNAAGDTVLGAQGWYDNVIWVNPLDANFLLWGGIDLWRSTDGGVTFTQISDWAAHSVSGATSAHADQHVIVAHPSFDNTSNKTVFFGNDGGIYMAADISTIPACTPFINSCKTGWTELNNGLAITQYYGGAGHPGTGKITGGTQDNGTLLFDPTLPSASESWTRPFGGDGGFSAYDPTDPNYFYGEYIYAQIHRNSTGGASASQFIHRVNDPDGLTDAKFGNAEFIAAFRLDPGNANRLLVGTLRLWRSNNVKAATPTWEYIRDTIGGNQFVTAIGVAPSDSNIVYVGYGTGQLYKTTVATSAAASVLASWTTIDNNGATNPLPFRRITRITVDPTNANVVYVTFGGFSGDNVYKSINGGTSWTDVTGVGGTGLPDVPVRSLVINPANTNWIYVGTEVGIFASETGGTTWSLPHDAPSNVSVDELFFLGAQLVAVTHGRGMFRSVPLGVPSITGPPAQSTQIGVPVTANFTVADADTPLANLTLSGSSSNTTLLPNANITFGGADSNRTVTLTPAAGQAGTATVTLTVSDGLSSASASFQFSVNAPPTISPIANQSILVGQTASASVTIADAETNASLLTLSGSSSNTALLPNAGMTFSGTGGSRTVTLTPAAGATGGATVTITVSDGTASASTTFTLTVTAAPTISSIANQNTAINTPVTVNFTVADADTALASLTLSGSSSNTTVLANSGISFGGSSGARTVTLTPVSGAFGATTVTLTVSDGASNVSTTFTLTVTAPPVIAAIANQTTGLSTPVTINVLLTDPDTALSSLTLSGSSSNVAVLPNAGISFAGSGGTRTATLTPAGVGTTNVTLTVGDGTALASTSFTLTVTAGPSNLTAVVRGNLVTLQWSAATLAGLTGYQLEAGVSAGTTQQVVPVGLATSFSTSAPSGVYFVRVRALLNNAPHLASGEISIAVGSAAAPGAPTNLLVLMNANTVHLAWHNQDVGGTRSSTMLEAFTPAGAPITTLPLDPSLTSYAVPAPAGSYSLRVRAVGPSLQSVPSNNVLISVPGTCAAPAAPVGFTATSSGGLATMSWNLGAIGTPAPSTFVLSAGSTLGSSNVGSVTLPGRSFAVPIPPGTYFLRVKAVNACGQSSPNTTDVTLVVP